MITAQEAKDLSDATAKEEESKIFAEITNAEEILQVERVLEGLAQSFIEQGIIPRIKDATSAHYKKHSYEGELWQRRPSYSTSTHMYHLRKFIEEKDLPKGFNWGVWQHNFYKGWRRSYSQNYSCNPQYSNEMLAASVAMIITKKMRSLGYSMDGLKQNLKRNRSTVYEWKWGTISWESPSIAG